MRSEDDGDSVEAAALTADRCAVIGRGLRAAVTAAVRTAASCAVIGQGLLGRR